MAVDVPKVACRCGVMMAEVIVPTTLEGDVPACWVCAHDYHAHDRPLGGGTSGVPCDCSREQIYPAEVLEHRAFVAAAAVMTEPCQVCHALETSGIVGVPCSVCDPPKVRACPPPADPYEFLDEMQGVTPAPSRKRGPYPPGCK